MTATSTIAMFTRLLVSLFAKSVTHEENIIGIVSDGNYKCHSSR